MKDITKVWPKWEVVETLGQGGFGTVYKAKRETFGDVTYSAIKVVKIPQNQAEVKEMTGSGMSRENVKQYYYKGVVSLINEIKLMETMKSAPNIVTIDDFEVVENSDSIGWTIYIRMELLTNLRHYYENNGKSLKEVVKMGIDICQALEHCRQLNIIHRDIKPDNIFVSRFGDYKLGDFGVSREAEKSMATMSQKGTKSYMAPEMIRMEKYGYSVDTYALGLTMYELLNHDRMPFLPPYPEFYYPEDREEATIKRLTGEEFPDIEGIGELNAIIKKACHYDPSMRYDHASEMKEDLSQYLLTLTDDDEIKEVQHQIKDNDQTEGLFDNGLFDEKKDDDQTIGMFDTDIFSNQIKEKEDSDQTLGMFGTGLFDHIDVEEVKKEVKKEVKQEEKHDYYIMNNNRKAYLVFTHGYYDGYTITLTKQDPITTKLKDLYLKYLSVENKKAVLKQMIALDDCAILHYRLAKEYVNTLSKKLARDEYKKAYALDPNNADICHGYALTLFEEKQYDQAYTVINQAIELANNNQVRQENILLYIYYTKAIILQKLRRNEEALKVLLLAQQLMKNYSFEVHDFKTLTIINENAVYEYLHQKNTSYIQLESTQEGYEALKAMTITNVYAIGHKIYKDIASAVAKKYKISSIKAHAASGNLFMNALASKDSPLSAKMSFSKSYVFGQYCFYIMPSFTGYIHYLCYNEIYNANITYDHKDIVIKKEGSEVRLPVNTKDAPFVLELLTQINQYNTKLLKE